MKSTLEKPLQRKTISEMTPEELREAIRPTAEQLIQDTWDKGTYFSYYDEALCPDEETVIHEYKDRKELMRFDEQGNTTLIRIL